MPNSLRALVASCALMSACNMWNAARVDPTAGGATGSSGGSQTGMPCEVDALLGNYCRSCHGAVPTGGAPMSLMTYDDLMAPAKTMPSLRVADLSLTRMQDTASPMPPAGSSAPSATDIQAFAAWLAAGTPTGSCATGPDPLNAAPTCTSGQTVPYVTDDGSANMNPGQACVSCHVSMGTSREAPRFLAGTVYPTGHEPSQCNGANLRVDGAQVIITDANGAQVPLRVTSSGNFYTTASIATPYTARVEYMGRTRAMAEPQTSGDCNSCHTQDGANGAPGRITLP